MRTEYDFSKGVRGKFYRADIELNLPIYLDPDVSRFVQALAKKKNMELETLINDLLRKNIDFIEEYSKLT